jgi:flagellar motor switch protein FliN/FliY
MSANAAIGEGGTWLVTNLCDMLAQSLEAMTLERPKIGWAAVSPAEKEPSLEEKWSWWEQPISAGPGTTFWIGASEETLLEVGRFALTAAGIDDASPDDCQGTWREIIGQALSGTASLIGRRLRKEVNPQGGSAVAKTPDTSFDTLLSLDAGGTSRTIRFAWSKVLNDALEPKQEPAPAPPPSASSGASSAAAAASGHRSAHVQVDGSQTLGLLMEVELPVSVSFGRAQLLLKDVIKLNSGSIVELNRSISEPVEVIVNNCVIARGEVVVVEGNYGVKIKQIISKEERLRTLY